MSGPSGLERIDGAAGQYGWTRRPDSRSVSGWTSRKLWDRGDLWVEVKHDRRGSVIGAHRNWGVGRWIDVGPSKADRVLAWMAERPFNWTAATAPVRPSETAAPASEEPIPAQTTSEAVRGDVEALEAAGVPVTTWAAKGTDSVVRDLRAAATRLTTLAAELAGAEAEHALAGSAETFDGITLQLEITSEGVSATARSLEAVMPTILQLWLEQTYGIEFARKFRKASRMVREEKS